MEPPYVGCYGDEFRNHFYCLPTTDYPQFHCFFCPFGAHLFTDAGRPRIELKGVFEIMASSKFKLAVVVAISAVIAVQWYKIISLQKQLATLREQPATVQADPTPDTKPDPDQGMNSWKVDRVAPSGQPTPASRSHSTAPAKTPDSQTAKDVTAPPTESLRELGMAVARDDSAAIERLAAMVRAEGEFFKTNSAGLTDQQRAELAGRVFSPHRVVFDVLTEQAANGSQSALRALARTVSMPELKGAAVKSLGVLAGKGDDAALEILLSPESYDLLLSSAVPALQPAADKGNQRAIDALVAVTTNGQNQPLWFMTIEALRKSAITGNQSATEGLIALMRSDNPNVQRQAFDVLQRAAANHNAKAAEALRGYTGP
jgi:hypothetical protein